MAWRRDRGTQGEVVFVNCENDEGRTARGSEVREREGGREGVFRAGDLLLIAPPCLLFSHICLTSY